MCYEQVDRLLASLIIFYTVTLLLMVNPYFIFVQDGGEEFVSVQIVPLNSHIVLLVGGNFHWGNGR